jgi:hypothetical protein
MNKLNANLNAWRGRLTLSLIEQYDHVKFLIDLDFQEAIECLDRRDDDSNNKNDINNEKTDGLGNTARENDSFACMSDYFLSNNKWTIACNDLTSTTTTTTTTTKSKTNLDRREKLVFMNLKMIDYIDTCLKSNVQQAKHMKWHDAVAINDNLNNTDNDR